MTKNLEDQIKKALIEGTDSAPGLKDDVWQGIENELNKEKAGIRMTRRKEVIGPPS